MVMADDPSVLRYDLKRDRMVSWGETGWEMLVMVAEGSDGSRFLEKRN